MRAGRIDAFAAPVGDFAERQRRRRETPESPRRTCRRPTSPHPARDQSQRHAALARRQRGALRRFFEVQQAEIILAALAHDGFFFALGGIGIEPRDLLHDLALQIAGVGRHPQTRRRSSPPTGLRAPDSPASCRCRCPLRPARSFGAPAPRAGRRRKSPLRHRLPARGAACPPSCDQPRARFVGVDGMRARLAGRRFVFPLRQAAPDFEPRDGRACGTVRQHGVAAAAPAPARPCQAWRPAAQSRLRLRGMAAQLRPAEARRTSNSARGGFGRLRQYPGPQRAPVPARWAQRAGPGRTKANSSSTSKSGLAAGGFSRPATKAACATSTLPEWKIARASSVPTRRQGRARASMRRAGRRRHKGDQVRKASRSAGSIRIIASAAEGERKSAPPIGIEIGQRAAGADMLADHHLGRRCAMRGVFAVAAFLREMARRRVTAARPSPPAAPTISWASRAASSHLSPAQASSSALVSSSAVTI